MVLVGLIWLQWKQNENLTTNKEAFKTKQVIFLMAKKILK